MTKWTRKEVIQEILRRESAGLPLALGGAEAVDSSLYQAAVRHFGSWRNAVVAAGISARKAKAHTPWPASKVLGEIRSLSRRRRPLRPGELKDRHRYLVESARRCFGSWTNAVATAGVDPARLRRAVPWTKERIIEAILTRALNGEPLGNRSVRPGSLAEAGARLFGSWKSSLAAAGVDPEVCQRQCSGPPQNVLAERQATPVHSRRRPGRRWTQETVLQTILMRLRENRRMNATAVCNDDDPLYRAAKRLYGSWREALLAAGLNLDEIRQDSRRRGDHRSEFTFGGHRSEVSTNLSLETKNDAVTAAASTA